MGKVYTVILGGGRGQRLYPLTQHRAKPAVPLAGKYRLIDITLSNAINSGFRDIAVLTQFNSASLNNHLFNTYRFDMFNQGRVEVLAAEQTESGSDWYQGTADAVRKQLRRLADGKTEHILILSGDHLYRMDYAALVQRHLETGADVTVSVIPVDRSEVHGFGVLSPDEAGQIRAFREKPKTEEELTPLAPPASLAARWGLAPEQFVVSMGVYVFRIDVLREMLANPDNNDFGGDILPAMISSHKVMAHLFNGYWRDIGTIRSFFEANLALTEENPPFRFYHPDAPIYTRSRFLPASKFLGGQVSRSIVSDGCVLFGDRIEHSVIGIRSRVGRGAVIKDAILMGADYYEDDTTRAGLVAKGEVPVGVGTGAWVERAILDKNARIGEGAILVGAPHLPDQDGDGWFIRDGIIIVAKDVTIPPGARIGAA